MSNPAPVSSHRRSHAPPPSLNTKIDEAPSKRRDRWLATALITIGILLLLSTLLIWRWTSLSAHPAEVPMPAQLAGLAMTASKQGLAAVVEINRLHDNRFPLSGGAMGHYGNRGEITLWVSGSPVGFMASRMIEVMRDRIAEGNSPFEPVGVQEDGGRRVYVLVGMGQRHFYFRSGNLVIWLAANEDIAAQALTQTLEFYP